MLHLCSIAIVTYVVPLCFWISTCVDVSTLFDVVKGGVMHDASLLLLSFFARFFSCVLYDRGSHHQLFDIIKKGENEDYTVKSTMESNDNTSLYFFYDVP